jgi:hypothetical protein
VRFVFVLFLLTPAIASAGPTVNTKENAGETHSSEWVCRNIVYIPKDNAPDPIKEIVISLTTDNAKPINNDIVEFEVTHIARSGKEIKHSKQYQFFKPKDSQDGVIWKGVHPTKDMAMRGEIVTINGVPHYREVLFRGNLGDHQGPVLMRTDSICKFSE